MNSLAIRSMSVTYLVSYTCIIVIITSYTCTFVTGYICNESNFVQFKGLTHAMN